MFILRPVESKDAESLYKISCETGIGFTSLQPDKDCIEKKIELALNSFQQSSDPTQKAALYFFVLEDTETKKIIGTSGIKSFIGMNKPWYSYKVSKQVHACSKLGVYNSTDILLLCNDHTGCSELCSLFLKPKFRGDFCGSLLSRSRFIFIAANSGLFGNRIIAEMRGFFDKYGKSPFWESFVRKFLPLEFADADALSTKDKSFIAELMPRHPIYTNLLDAKTVDAIGVCHTDTISAVKILEKEGFNFNNYIDIFDGGPLLECNKNQSYSIESTKFYRVTITDKTISNTKKYLIANDKTVNFKCTVTDEIEIISHEEKLLSINSKLADSLLISENDKVFLLCLTK